MRTNKGPELTSEQVIRAGTYKRIRTIIYTKII